MAGLLAVLGILVLVDTSQLSTNLASRGPVGPKAVPTVIGVLLIVVAIALAVDVLRGGRGEPEGGEDVDLSQGSDWKTIAILVGAFGANALLIDVLGWPISGAILFVGCTFALGSRHVVRDVVIGVVLGVGTWYLFVLGLGVSLPVGVLKGIL
jgi:putative tricarboxylic transport membrane protein